MSKLSAEIRGLHLHMLAERARMPRSRPKARRAAAKRRMCGCALSSCDVRFSTEMERWASSSVSWVRQRAAAAVMLWREEMEREER